MASLETIEPAGGTLLTPPLTNQLCVTGDSDATIAEDMAELKPVTEFGAPLALASTWTRVSRP